MLMRLCHYFSLRPYWLALLISGILLFWMLLKPSTAPLTEVQSTAKNANFPKVEITHFIPQKMTKSLTLYGRSEANSRVLIRAEVAGKIVKIAVEKGRTVKTDTTLAVIEKSALPERLAQAHALLEERLLTYKAAKSLNEKGLQGRVRLAEVNSLLLAAKTEVKELQLQLQRTKIVAPFTGILQEQFAAQGDYLQIGDAIFSLEDIDPIIIRGDMTEHYIKQLKLGQNIAATLLSGARISGKISYIASYSDPDSRTFRIEGEFPNPDLKLFSGISAELSVPLYPVMAIYVSPSVLAMDEEGNLGVKSVQQGVVVFKRIEFVDADNEGVWLSGFSVPVDIITLGQGFVNNGERVEAVPARRDDENGY